MFLNKSSVVGVAIGGKSRKNAAIMNGNLYPESEKTLENQ